MFGCEVLSVRFLIINSNMVLVVSASRTLVNGASYNGRTRAFANGICRLRCIFHSRLDFLLDRGLGLVGIWIIPRDIDRHSAEKSARRRTE